MSATRPLHCDGKDTNNKSASSEFSTRIIEIRIILCIFSRFLLQVEWHMRYFWVDLVIQPHGGQK